MGACAMSVVETQSLTKFYGKHRGIVDVSFSIEKGEIFGFIGPNGAGKSTTIRSMLGLIFPTSGKATIFGLDSVKDTKEIKRRVGYLPAEVEYYDGMNTRELLEYSARFYRVDARDEIRELADLFDVDLKRPISDLSSGNKKKVSILQCFLHKPELVNISVELPLSILLRKVVHNSCLEIHDDNMVSVVLFASCFCHI